MFDKAFFSHMKTSAIFVNISRGGVVVESDLIEALREKQIRHAILDVFESEPLEENSALWELSNATITPHSSFISIGNKKRLFEVAQNNMTSVRAKQ